MVKEILAKVENMLSDKIILIILISFLRQLANAELKVDIVELKVRG